jgi:signal transduction histidine kinase/ActR/RegA family two-component response regulator
MVNPDDPTKAAASSWQLLEDEARLLETLNRVGKAVAAELDLERVVQIVTDAGTELSGAQFGSFFYNRRDEQGEAYWLYTLSGAPRESFADFPMVRNTAVFAPTFAGQAIVRSDDILKDPRYGKNEPHFGMPQGHLPVRSYLAVPVTSRSGEVLGGLLFGHPAPGVFTERAERLVAGIASQAAIAIDNARLYDAAQKEIAERTRAEAKLRESEEALREADRRKDEFLATLAHELRNPLAPIRNAVEIMRLAQSDPIATASARSLVERQLKQLVRLIDDLLDVSRITQGRLELRREKLDLATALRTALETSRPLIQAKSHTMHVAWPSAPLFVDVDATRIAQVFANLLNNSAKYSAPGSAITVQMFPEGDAVVVTVTDNGVGIPPVMLGRVFEMFERVTRAGDGVQDGLGIGLTLVRRLVELHGGTVTAHSAGLNQGSTFTVRLPAWQPLMPVAALAARASSLAASTPEAARRRILVADDNRDAATSLALLLEMEGHDVRRAYDGVEAVAIADEFRPDVALLDIGMPRLDGYGAARELRGREWAKDMLLLALTGWGQNEDKRLAREAGFDRHLTKPVDPDILRNLVAGARAAAAGDVAR